MAEKLDAKVDPDKNAFAHKAIIIVTDGEDRVSGINEKKLISLLHERGATVYAIGLVDELKSEGRLTRKSPREKAVDFLKNVTRETGGRVIFPKTGQADIDVVLSELLP